MRYFGPWRVLKILILFVAFENCVNNNSVAAVYFDVLKTVIRMNGGLV